MDDIVRAWMAGYRLAWDSNAPDDVRAIFTEDARYFASPSAAPWVGHDEIVAGWLEERDEPGTTTFEWWPVAAQGATAVVRCEVDYVAGATIGVYDNLWVMRFAPDGRAEEFTDWWVRRGD